ncbi:hypothetical protein [Ferrovum myxofaciens]|uniref:Uncharacterized protein n=1 Tax=Ferrovum myxofaciens TaxID=416213 RepID=A0A9E6MYX7_9PROT|nr:hypothetical protein [Ferrovum myxofaciens]QKE37414.1 MAG: hypothetical protein HO273_00605 [Ferrovum myxofaciens]QWY75062.1 MAG: hypothetical protein JVY19_01030 [Ferrovum myxofaciens]QWY77801.1 MAG: hypothetical protein JZL65_01555 [Ferrovum myxofaciens]
MSVKNLVVSPPQLGRISIGMTVQKNDGKRLPQKTDSIRITGNAMVNGDWVDHPIMATSKKDEQGKMRDIPIRILFDAVGSNLQTNYSCFDMKGRQVCVGDGETAKRRAAGVIESIPCPGPDYCEFAKTNRCKLYTRFTVGIDDGSYEANPTAGFTFRSTGWNSAKALAAQLAVFSAACGGKMAGFPAVLKLRGKSTSASMKSIFYYLDLIPKDGLVKAVIATKERRATLEASGLLWDAIEKVVAEGLSASAFAEDGEDGTAIVQEFFADEIDTETGEVKSKVETKVEAVLTEAETEQIKAGLLKAGRDIASLNNWLGRASDAPLATMGIENFIKVKSALGIPVVASAAAVPAVPAAAAA